MDTSSIINRQFSIHYARSREIELAAGTSGASTKKPKISTKEWVLSTFYPSAKAGRSSASVDPVTDGGTVLAANDKIAETQPLPKDDSNRSHEPAVSFRQVVIDSAAKKFKFSLVGKFYRYRPCLVLIRKWVLAELRLVGKWSVTLLDRNHVLIKLDNEDDMLRIWPRSRWFVRGHWMKVFKWTSDFRPSDGEPSTAPVWISFPSLPVVYFEQDLLYAIASLLGRVLSMDVPTRRLSRTNVARVCVEVDLLKEHPHQVWVGVEKGGFWQAVKYERLPSYCTNCRQQGHSLGICKVKRNSVSDAYQNKSSNLEEGEDIKPGDKQPGASVSLHGTEEGKGKEGCKEPPDHLILPNQDQQCLSARVPAKRVSHDALTMEKMPRIRKKKGKPPYISYSDISLLEENMNELEEDGSSEEQEQQEELVEIEEEKGKEVETSNLMLASSHQQEDKQTSEVVNSTLEKESLPKSRKKKAPFFWKTRSKQPKDMTKFSRLTMKQFSLKELKVATGGFSERFVVGRGGYGTVYKGELDGLAVAVKRFDHEQADHTFVNEVERSRIAVHKNLLQLIGLCISGSERLLVYPFMANKSLCTYLRGCTPNVPLLDWCARKRIAVGAAQGLSYLHEQIKLKIIHRDVKPSNILLNDEFEPVICDFGLAKIIDCKNECVSTNVICGTYGYMAPEYIFAGKVSDKTDVYGYGVTLLELITARKIFDVSHMNSSEEGALPFVKRMLKEKDLGRIVDPRLGGNYKRAEVMEHLRIAFLCMNRFPEKRPNMSWVVWMLEGEGLAGRADDEKLLELIQMVEQFSLDGAVACNNIPSLCQEGMQLEEDTIETSGEESKKAEVEMAQDQRISEGAA